MNHQVAAEKRSFKRSLNDMRGRDLLNLLIEHELLLILHPDDSMVAYKREACYDVAEWRLRETENREENTGTRVSHLRSRIKTTLKKKDVKLSEKAIVAANQAVLYERRMAEKRSTTFNKGYDFALSQVKCGAIKVDA